MTVRLYTKGRPDGMEKDPSLFPQAAEAVEREGGYQGTCPCCTKRIVLRRQGEPMLAKDWMYLQGEHDG